MTVQTDHTLELSDAELFVVHPLFDVPEEKCDPSKLDRLKMSASVRLSLLVLRGYLILITMMFSYHMLDLMGLFGHHAAK